MPCYGEYGEETKVYIGNLETGDGKGELERAFSYSGPLRTLGIAGNPPGFAFVEFKDIRDTEDAVQAPDGRVISGSRVRVQLSTGLPGRSWYDRPPASCPLIQMTGVLSVARKIFVIMIVTATAGEGEASHDLDFTQDPEEGDSLGHEAGAVEGGQDLHLLQDQDLPLCVDLDLLQSSVNQVL